MPRRGATSIVPYGCDLAEPATYVVHELGPHQAVPMRLQTTGSFAVYSRATGKERTPKGRKSRALLAYLASRAGTRVSKSRLAALLWGDRADVQARASLRQALRGSFSVGPADDAPEIRDAFEDLDHITPEFDEWLGGERSRRSRRRIAELRTEVEGLLRTGRGYESIRLIEQMQGIDPHDEDALRLGMQADFEQGHPAAIAERYRAAAAILRTDIGIEPSDESRDLRDRLIRRLNTSYTPVP
jgi:DNA-binding SARP family transcriptional activator